MVSKKPVVGHRAGLIALESFVFPTSPFEDLAFAKIAASTADAIAGIMGLSTVQSPQTDIAAST
jgi:hypothetical protein